jgi:hypothetical protein
MKRPTERWLSWSALVLGALCFQVGEGFQIASDGTCSCDCCMVAERLPSDVTVDHQGNLNKHKCEIGPSKDMCPNSCTAFNSHDLVDYNRFCLMDCLPETPSVGAMCLLRLDPLSFKRLDRSGIPVDEDPEGDGVLPLFTPPPGAGGAG